MEQLAAKESDIFSQEKIDLKLKNKLWYNSLNRPLFANMFANS